MVSFALKLEPRGLDAAAILTVRGDLDMYTVPESQERLAELTESERDGLVVVNQDPEVRRVFDVMGLDEFLTVVATRSEATHALAAA